MANKWTSFLKMDFLGLGRAKNTMGTLLLCGLALTTSVGHADTQGNEIAALKQTIKNKLPFLKVLKVIGNIDGAQRKVSVVFAMDPSAFTRAEVTAPAVIHFRANLGTGLVNQDVPIGKPRFTVDLVVPERQDFLTLSFSALEDPQQDVIYPRQYYFMLDPAQKVFSCEEGHNDVHVKYSCSGDELDVGGNTIPNSRTEYKGRYFGTVNCLSKKIETFTGSSTWTSLPGTTDNVMSAVGSVDMKIHRLQYFRRNEYFVLGSKEHGVNSITYKGSCQVTLE